MKLQGGSNGIKGESRGYNSEGAVLIDRTAGKTIKSYYLNLIYTKVFVLLVFISNVFHILESINLDSCVGLKIFFQGFKIIVIVPVMFGVHDVTRREKGAL